METTTMLSKFFISDLQNDEELRNQYFSNLAGKLCFDKKSKISGDVEDLNILKKTLVADRNILQTACYYHKSEQKIWLDQQADLINEALLKNEFKYTQSRLMNEQVLSAIKSVIEIYETKDTGLINELRELIKVQFEAVKHKLVLVENKINQLLNQKNDTMEEGYSNFFTPVKKDKEGFAIPFSKNTNEKKRELKDQKSEQSNKRREFSQNPEKENKSRNNESSSSHEEQNDGYQSN